MPASRVNGSAGDSYVQASMRHQYYNGSQQPYKQQYPMTVKQGEFQHSSQSSQSGDLLSDDVSQITSFAQQYCTLDSSATAGYPIQNSPSNISITPTSGSPISQQEYQSDNIYGSPFDSSCLTEDPNELKIKLRELEEAMLGPESDIADSYQNFQSQQSLESERCNYLMQIRGDLKQMLIACARAISEEDMPVVNWLVEELENMVSVSGDPLQRLGAYLREGLIARLASSGSSIYKALKCKEPLGSDLRSYMSFLYEACPYFKFGYMSANGAIAEAVRGEDRVHIIDFQIAMGTQWVTLIQALAARPGGPPHLRVTGLDDPVSLHARGGGLHLVGKYLAQLAESCNVPFEFHPLEIRSCDVEAEHLDVRYGEVLVVNFTYQLHHMPDESVNTWNHRDRLIRMIKGLSPRVVTLVEQESNTNTSPFFPRFVETLDFYTAIFESIDATALPRENKERINVEQHCLARDIVNIIACEGADRVERHELLGKWRSRFMMAGFKPYPLSSLVNAAIKSLLEKYNENFRLEERDGALYLGWKNRALVTSCAWR